LPSVPEGRAASPEASRGFQRVLQRAAFHVQSSGKERLEGHNVLIAIFAEPESPAAEALKAEGVTRYDVVNYVSHGVAKDGSDDDALELAENEQHEDDEDGPAEPRGDPLKQFAVNLNERAKNGEIEPLIGREKEIRRAIQVLCRRKKNNPLFVGDAGVGKTAIVKASRIASSRKRSRRRC
jgi:ATP-dependent Clp protease ATP-binding subunit ClpA